MNKKESSNRIHLNSRFTRESLVDRKVLSSSEVIDEIAILPYLDVISVGGSSIIDKGKSAVFPLVDELVSLKGKFKFAVGVTGGVRVKHAMAIGLDFGLPVGGLAMIVGANEEQNANMLYSLMAKHGAVRVPKDDYADLPHYLVDEMIPILTLNPPHHYWEKPPKKGVLPESGADFGAYMTAEGMGARSMIFVKDQDGLYDKNPSKHADAKLIKRISAQEILEGDFDELIIDKLVIEMLAKARHLKQIHIVNGLKPGNITKALNGENGGTIIYKKENE